MSLVFFVKNTFQPITEKENVVGCEMNKTVSSCKNCKVIKVRGVCNFITYAIRVKEEYEIEKAR